MTHYLVRHRRKGDQYPITEMYARSDPKQARKDAEARARELRQRQDVVDVEIEERQ